MSQQVFNKGDRVRDRNSLNAARTGVVICVSARNPPWHEGGRPFVRPDDGGPVQH